MFGFGKKKEKNVPAEPFEEYADIINPPSSFDGYEIVDDSKENLSNLCKILTNNLVDVQKVSFEDKYQFVDSLVELNYITNDFQQQSNLTEIVGGINAIAQNLNYSIQLSVEHVLRLDGEKAQQAREHFKYLYHYDLNVCAELLEQQGYELFQVFLDCGGFTMSILPKDKISDLKQYTS